MTMKRKVVDKVDALWEKECLYINELHYNLAKMGKIKDGEDMITVPSQSKYAMINLLVNI